ncbi:Hypothetical_protein [Hexamita inflata]|uniref:Hypothetical_protein n=1 Tax=Hexamita inflata TaxID=28002 RepID=A0AA86P6Q0_9EUKA|nr:Hypothetical protein HINF_LOCUS20210 [Hexamita inflata]
MSDDFQSESDVLDNISMSDKPKPSHENNNEHVSELNLANEESASSVKQQSESKSFEADDDDLGSDFEGSDSRGNNTKRKSKQQKSKHEQQDLSGDNYIQTFLQDKDPEIKYKKLTAVMEALLTKNSFESPLTLENEARNHYSRLLDQNEASLIQFAKVLLNQREVLRNFASAKGFQAIAAFFGFNKMTLKPHARTQFPQPIKTRKILQILQDFNPQNFQYVYEDLKDSQLIIFINFAAKFPTQYCPSQTMKNECQSLLDKWAPSLKKAKEYAREHETLNIDSDDEDGKKRQKKQTVVFERMHDDIGLQAQVQQIKMKEQEEAQKKAKM